MEFESILQWIILAGGILFCWSRWVDWRRFVREHPPANYVHDEGVEAWRWANPPADLGLQRQDTLDYSRLYLPVAPAPEQKFALLVGGLLILWAFVQMFAGLGPNADRTEVVLSFYSFMLIGVLGFGMLHYESRLIAIDLYRDRVVFTLRYAVFLTRGISLKVSDVQRASGKLQSAFGQNRDQDTPYYFVYVKSRFRNRKFLTVCNPTQGSWLVGGLEHWRKGARRT